MNIIIFGAAGFIGTNLALNLMLNEEMNLTLVDNSLKFFIDDFKNKPNVRLVVNEFNVDTNFDDMLKGQDIVYHLACNVMPAFSGVNIYQELENNIGATVKLLDACVRCEVKKVVFTSSGGTVYGENVKCPIEEDACTNPISSYGIQKLAIEKLLYFYNHKYELDYRIIRLANPYGEYQRPNGGLGVIVNFIYKGLLKEPILIYGDGSIVRDFIYINDVVNAILKIVAYEGNERIFNLGSGVGHSLQDILEIIENILGCSLNVQYTKNRPFDVQQNFLDMKRFENEICKVRFISLEEGIRKTIDFVKRYYIAK